MSTGKIVLGVIAGLAAGSLLGVLFAPDKGSTTRKKIHRKGEDEIDALKDKFNDFIDNITQKFDKVKEEVVDFAEDAMNSVEDVEKEVKASKVK